MRNRYIKIVLIDTGVVSSFTEVSRFHSERMFPISRLQKTARWEDIWFRT